MADENLTFAIVFEEAERLVNGVRSASSEIQSLNSAVSAAAVGLGDAARSAIAGADAFAQFGASAADAKSAIDQMGGGVDVAIDTAPLEETAAAAQAASQAIAETSAAFEAVRSESELAADAMAALGFATAEEEAEAKLARDALDALAGVTGKAGQASEQASGGFGTLSRSLSALGTVAKGSLAVVGGMAAFRGISEIGRFIGDSLRTAAKEFLGAEKATIQFTSALASMQKYSSGAVASMREFAQSIQRTTTYSDDAVVSAAALIAQVGQLSGASLQRATQAAIDLSSVLGRDLQQAALLVGRGAAGATEAFGRFGIVVKGAGTDAEKFDRVLGEINRKFGGRAVAEAKSMGGAIEQLRNSWREFLETIGGTITVFEPVINVMSRALRKANQILGVETPKSALDAKSALDSYVESFREVQRLQKAPTPTQFPSALQPEEMRAPAVTPIDNIVEQMQKKLDNTLFAIKFTVEGGDASEIADVEMQIARLAKIAEVTNSRALAQIVQQMRFTFQAAKQVSEVKIETKGVEQGVSGLQEMRDLALQIMKLGGAGELQLIDASESLRQADSLAMVAESISSGVGLIEKSLQDAADAGKEIDAGVILQAYEAIDAAQGKIAEKYGQLPEAVARSFREMQARLRSLAARFDLPELKTVFSTEGFEEFLRLAGRGKAEVQAVGDLIKEINSQTAAQPLNLIDTSLAIEQAQTVEELTERLKAAIASFRAEVEQAAAKGQPAPAAGAPRVVEFVQRKQQELETQFGGVSPGVAKSFEEATEAARALAAQFPNLGEQAAGAARSIAAVSEMMERAFMAGLTVIMNGTANFAEVMKAIVRSMVNDILRELARLAARKTAAFFLSFIPGVGPTLAAAVGGRKAEPEATKLVIPSLERLQAAPAGLEFARIVQSRAFAEARFRRETRIAAAPAAPPRREPPRIVIEAVDGISVRRQITSGALRSELAREIRRSRL